jgi:hypothetical protein
MAVGWGREGWGIGRWGIDVTAGTPAGVEATISLGQETVIGKANVSVTGVSSTFSIGALTFQLGAKAYPVGLSAVGETGFALVWGAIAPSQNPGYTPINPTPGTIWTQIAV